MRLLDRCRTLLARFVRRYLFRNLYFRIAVAGMRYCTSKSARILHIRHRDIFTRRNKLRLRYAATSAFVLLLGVNISLNGQSDHYQLAKGPDYLEAPLELAAAAGVPKRKPMPSQDGRWAVGQVGKDITDLLDGTLYAKLSLASARLPLIPKPKDKTVEVRKGDALGVVMQRAGISNTDAAYVVKALSKHFNPKHLKPGHMLDVRFEPVDQENYLFTKAALRLNPVKSVIVERKAESFVASLEEKEVVRKLYAQRAEIDASVYAAAEKAGISRSTISNVIRIFSWDVDFQRDVRSGDSIEVLYDNFETEDGYVAKPGEILYAKLVVNGAEKPVYRFETKDGRVDYYDPDGKSIRKTLMKTPIDGAYVSSGFGMRRHPILGYTKMHQGVDFAARKGTPIYAAGDGIVEYSGRNGAYGKYVRIRHNRNLKTAYAHMHRIQKGVRSGTRVTQGQVIGTVGTTGRSTGPHLHYEVHVSGKRKNPRSLNLPTGENLGGEELVAFQKEIRRIDRQYASVSRGTQLASRRQSRNSKRIN